MTTVPTLAADPTNDDADASMDHRALIRLSNVVLSVRDILLAVNSYVTSVLFVCVVLWFVSTFETIKKNTHKHLLLPVLKKLIQLFAPSSFCFAVSFIW